MKNALLSLAGACALAVSFQVAAQDCATPLPITSDTGPHAVVNGDLCTATNSLPTYGGTASPQNEIVYSFTAQGANATIALTQGAEGTWSGQSAGIFLMPSPCSSSTDPIALGFPGTDMAVNGLTDGSQYFVIVTADPGSAAATCGTFTATVTGTLPVTLQSFTVG
jgi:hypothetical protein